MRSDFKFWRLKKESGITFLSFDVWNGVRVLYSTRNTGVSPKPFDSLNLYHGRGDGINNVRENKGRFFRAVSITQEDVVFTKQIRSDTITAVTDTRNNPVGDGLVSDTKGVFLGIFTADCVAVFLYSSVKHAVGVFHAGRKGVEKGICGKAIQIMCETYTINAGSIEALFGPSIGPCCYQVGREFEEKFDRQYLIKRGDGLYLDMWKCIHDELKQCSVNKILVPEICSCSRSDLFFSYRKSGAEVGENLGIIGMPA
ncbi:MAG: peptidoglycan editing factor PgeF [Candidatus Cloacimonadota bacterium]|nr:MAG: peptidoglycan editing factor PgeF [Candidatus Cloacimonadota bacterium]